MLIAFLAVIIALVIINLNLPILLIGYYLFLGTIFLLYLKKKKSDNILLWIFFIGFIGFLLYGITLTPGELIKALAEQKAANSYNSVYRNTTFNATDYQLFGSLYHVPVNITAGAFLIGKITVTVKLTFWHQFASYAFLTIMVITMALPIIIALKNRHLHPDSKELKEYKATQFKASISTQLLIIIILNIFILLFLSNEEFVIYASDSANALENAHYIGITNPLDIMLNPVISTLQGNFNVGFNFALLLFYILIIISAFIMSIGKRYRKYRIEKFLLFCYISYGLFIVGMIGICFTSPLLNYSVRNLSNFINYPYFFAYSNTNIFTIYQILSCIVITIFYAYIVYFNINRLIEKKRNTKENIYVDFTNNE